MNHDTNWHALQSAGQVAPATPEALTRARQQLQPTPRRRRQLVPVLAAAAAVLAAAVVIQQSGDDKLTPPTAVPPATPSQVPRTLPTSPAPVPPSPETNASCAFEPTRAELAKRGAALDGTVLRYAVAESNPPQYVLKVQVHKWFRGGSGQRQVTVRAWAAPGDGQLSELGPAWRIGSRLLIVGEPRTSNGQLLEVRLWGCGFSRPYSATDAATWRDLFKK